MRYKPIFSQSKNPMSQEQVKMSFEEFSRRWQLFEQEHFGSLEDGIDSLRMLVQTHLDLTSELAKSKRMLPSWQLFIETLSFKMILSSSSICNLSQGTLLGSKKLGVEFSLIDYSSIYVLTRSAIENYLTLDYIYFNDLPLEEKLFRFKLWELSGLKSRQKFSTGNNEEFETQKAFERAEIDKIMHDISRMPEYASLDKNQLRKLATYGLPRMESWNGLINASGLRKPLFSEIYSFYSNYAHSEYLSILQLRDNLRNNYLEESKEAVQNSLFIIRVLNSLSIKWHVSTFEECQAHFERLTEEMKSTINIWAMYGKD